MAKILLGVTGGIAAYKAILLMRLLQKEGHDIQVVMTPAAVQFIAPLTFQALTQRPILVEEFHSADSKQSALTHIQAAQWAEFVIVAPATANTIAKMAMGSADNLLTSLLLAVTCPIVVCPAMNNNMYNNKATQANLRTLIDRGIDVIPAAVGELACGDNAIGKMPEPESIVNYLRKYFSNGVANGEQIRVMVTAGPTIELIDPVRYISNRSSGKMGYAIANASVMAGAKVTLISGPVALESPVKNVIRVQSAMDMLDVLKSKISDCDILIMSAAVADYTPENVSEQKIKKSETSIELKLTRTADILKTVSAGKRAGQVLVGFAAESENVSEYAKKKLREKNLDMIVANDIGRTDIGFEVDENEVTIFYSNGEEEYISKNSKNVIADIIVKRAIEIWKKLQH